MKKRKLKKTKALDRSWNEILERHEKPLFATSEKPVTPTENSVSRIPSYATLGRQAGSPAGCRIVDGRHTASYTGPSVEKDRYEGELLQREIEAQKEVERKKKRVGIAYNKGAYQYITDETDPKDIGKK